jgi:hypothetical protein
MKIDIDGAVDKIVREVNRQVRTRAAEASNELRNAALDVLRGERSGRVYKKPSTYGKRMNKHTKNLLPLYGHKLRGGQLYQASAPGEPPAERTNTLRRSFEEKIAAENKAAYTEVKAYIETKQEYAAALDEGTDRMASRPIKEPVIERAKPRIRQIFSKPFD